MLLLAISLLLVNLVLLGGGVYVVNKRLEFFKEISIGVQEFFTSQGDTEASPFITTLGQVGGSIAREVTDGVNNAIAGSIGGTMKGAVAELEHQTVSENPALSIMDGMPKSIKKNPLAYMAMQALVNKHIPAVGGNNISVVSGNNGGGVKFKL